MKTFLRRTLPAVLAGSWSLLPAHAQTLSPADQARIRAGIIIAAYDDLAGQCTRQGGFSAAQRTEVERWREGQSIDRLRAHLDGPGLSAPVRAQVRDAASKLVQQVASRADPCLAAVSLTRTADARFAADVPQILASNTAPGGGSTAGKPASNGSQTGAPASAASRAGATSPAGAPSPVAGSPASSGSGQKLAALIEGFGFDTCTKMGFGGMVMVSACPVVLFRDGRALTDVEGLSHPAGLQDHQARFPKEWTRWRRSGGNVQLRDSEGWSDLGFTAVYTALPANFRLDARYRAVGGAGTVAIGGNQAVVAWTDYVFTRDGRVRRDGGAGASAADGGVAVTTSGRAPGKSGRYRVEGLILAIDYDDGTRERRVIIADPKDQGRGTMWLDGEGYVVRD